MKKECKATIKFGDDYGDNSTTFHCKLKINHKGKHQEIGDVGYDTVPLPYLLTWEGTTEDLDNKMQLDLSAALDEECFFEHKCHSEFKNKKSHILKCEQCRYGCDRESVLLHERIKNFFIPGNKITLDHDLMESWISVKKGSIGTIISIDNSIYPILQVEFVDQDHKKITKVVYTFGTQEMVELLKTNV